MLRNMKTFAKTGSLQDSIVSLHGEPCTVFRSVDPVRMQGYENRIEYNQRSSKVYIDFHVKRRWFYHFNWFPENEDRISMGYFSLGEDLAQDDYIRTKTIEHVSPYGDLLFKVVKIGDDGRYYTLRRIAFLYAIDDSTLYETLKVL